MTTIEFDLEFRRRIPNLDENGYEMLKRVTSSLAVSEAANQHFVGEVATIIENLSAAQSIQYADIGRMAKPYLAEGETAESVVRVIGQISHALTSSPFVGPNFHKWWSAQKR
jgi:hypothetical protein